MAKVIDCEGTSNTNPELNLDYGKLLELFGLKLPQNVGKDKSVPNSINDQSVESLRALCKPIIVEAVQNIIPSVLQNARGLENKPLPPVVDEPERNDRLLTDNEPNSQLESEDISLESSVHAPEETKLLYASAYDPSLSSALKIFVKFVVPELKKKLQDKFSLRRNSESIKSENEISTVEDFQTPTNGLDDYSLLNPSIQIKTIVVEQRNGDQQPGEEELKEEGKTNDEVAVDNDSNAKTNGWLDFVTSFGTRDGGEIKPSQEVLRFHSVHGDNICLSENNFQAQRKKKSNFFSKGIAFSSRPVVIGEKVSLRLKQLSSYWLGLITIGFTTNDPKSIANNLPASVINERNCADGFWAEHLDKKYYQENCRIHYYLNSSGNMCFGVNGVDEIEFLWHLKTTTPVWALIDVFGYYTTVEFDILEKKCNTSFVEKSSLLSERTESSDSFCSFLEFISQRRISNYDFIKLLNYQSRFVGLDLYTHFEGSCMEFLEDRGICITTGDKGGCIESKFPPFPGQIIVIQNVSVRKALFHVSLKYSIGGLTNDAYSTLPDITLYFTTVHIKDELFIIFTESGEIQVMKNLEEPLTTFTVSRSQELCLFVKVFQKNHKIKLWTNNEEY